MRASADANRSAGRTPGAAATKCAAVLLALVSLASAAEPPKLRLGDAVRPTHYTAELTLDPGKDTFTGVIDIDVNVREPRDTIWLNAVDIKIADAAIGGKAAGTIPGSAQVIGLSTGALLPAGPTRIHISYQGRISRNSSAGIFELQEDGRWYLYTQFEATDARRAFPCFDEPSFKTPWDITLRVPQQFMALANTPAISESDAGGGQKLVRFATTRPLASYLAAFAVGPFEAVDLGNVGRGHTPMRIIVPHGRKSETGFAAESIPQLLRLLEDYFNIPFPYSKLDSLVMPVGSFAMENVGLITYGEGLLLSKPENDSIARQRECAIVTAHEMAHQWFGDLVTTAWWDDIWLNEAFATWMETKMVGEWKPAWHMEATEVNDRLTAMETDSRAATRKIRQAIASDDDIENAFDDITYQKGAAVIRMFETWVGAARFRAGVRQYLQQNADGNADAAGFLAAIGKAAGMDVAPAFSTFLDQAGVPVVAMDLDCGGRPRIVMSQKRYLSLGSQRGSQETWRIPVCVKYEAGGNLGSQCGVLSEARGAIALQGAASCPAWVMGNDGANGYYRVTYPPATLQHLLAAGVQHLSLAEKLGLLGDVRALVDSGDMQAADALALLPQFAKAEERQIVELVRRISLYAVGSSLPDDVLPKGRQFIRDLFGERAMKLGWKAAPGDTDDTRLLRQSLVPHAAREGLMQPLIGQAEELAHAWLKDHAAVDPGMVGSVLSVAAQFGDRGLFDALVAALPGEKDARSREAIFRALGSFGNAELARAGMRLYLTGNYDAREAFFALVFGPLRQRETRTLPFEFVQQNLSALLARLPSEAGTDYAGILPSAGGGFCDAAGRQKVEEFFRDRVKNYLGGPRRLAQTLEGIDICIAWTKANIPGIAEFLRKY